MLHSFVRFDAEIRLLFILSFRLFSATLARSSSAKRFMRAHKNGVARLTIRLRYVSCRCAWHFTSWVLAASMWFSLCFFSLIFCYFYCDACLHECMCHCIYAVVHYLCVASEHMCVSIFFFRSCLFLLSFLYVRRIAHILSSSLNVGTHWVVSKKKQKRNERKTKKIRRKGQ